MDLLTNPHNYLHIRRILQINRPDYLDTILPPRRAAPDPSIEELVADACRSAGLQTQYKQIIQGGSQQVGADPG